MNALLFVPAKTSVNFCTPTVARAVCFQRVRARVELLVVCIHVGAMFQKQLNHAGIISVGIGCRCPVNRSLLVAAGQRVSGSRNETATNIILAQCLSAKLTAAQTRMSNAVGNALTRRAGSHQRPQAEELLRQAGPCFQQQHAARSRRLCTQHIKTSRLWHGPGRPARPRIR